MANSLNKADVGPLFDLIQSPPLWTPAPTPVDDLALDRILEAVGKNFLPVALNRKALWTAIVEADNRKKLIDRLRRGARSSAIVKSMKHISQAAKSLRAAVKKMMM